MTTRPVCILGALIATTVVIGLGLWLASYLVGDGDDPLAWVAAGVVMLMAAAAAIMAVLWFCAERAVTPAGPPQARDSSVKRGKGDAAPGSPIDIAIALAVGSPDPADDAGDGTD